MSKKSFKPYSQAQGCLFPMYLEDRIPQDSPVRLINQIIDNLDISKVIDTYKGGGTSSYHPRPELTTYSNLGSGETWIGNRLWDNSYYAINLCNTMLKYLDYAKPQEKTAREAELRVIRSYFWWVLTESFGDIHFNTEPNRGAGTAANRTSPETVYEQILKDLEFAVAGNNLPDASADLGRVTKPAAEALLARIYLTRGKNAEAITYAKKVINNYNYALENLDNLWDLDKQRSNKETIWAIYHYANNAINGEGAFLHSAYTPQYTVIGGMNSANNTVDGQPSGHLMPTYHLLSLFDQANDGRFEASFKSVWYANFAATIPRWKAEDAAAYGDESLRNKPRYAVGDVAGLLAFRVLAENEKFPKVPYNTYDVNDLYDPDTKIPVERRLYFNLKKHLDTKQTANTNTSRDFVMIRLSEMYLIIAEADFKINGSDASEGLKYLNDLRKMRATPTADPSFTNVTSIPDIDFILDERARELCGEQLRWMDLKRTGKLLERVQKYNPDADMKSFHIVRPIPASQILQVSNPEEFKQNEGY
jgi:tetratricopeptide (TPR) repeat protein